jgi:hypothetical protein
MAEVQIRVLIVERVPTNSTSARTYGSSRSTLRERITEESLSSGIRVQIKAHELKRNTPEDDDEIAAAARP